MAQLSDDAKRVLEASYPGSEFLNPNAKKDKPGWLDLNKLNPTKLDWSFPNFSGSK